MLGAILVVVFHGRLHVFGIRVQTTEGPAREAAVEKPQLCREILGNWENPYVRSVTHGRWHNSLALVLSPQKIKQLSRVKTRPRVAAFLVTDTKTFFGGQCARVVE